MTGERDNKSRDKIKGVNQRERERDVHRVCEIENVWCALFPPIFIHKYIADKYADIYGSCVWQ